MCNWPDRERTARDYVLGRLVEPEAAAFEDHVADCPTCATGVTGLAGALDRLDRAAAPVATIPGRVWLFLSRTVLAPGPALAYLVFLALALSWIGGLRTGGAPEGRPLVPEPSPEPKSLASVIPRVVKLFEEPVYRGLPQDGAAAPPEVVEAREPDALWLLELHTGITPDELAEPGQALAVELLEDERVVWSALRPAGDLDAEGVLRLALAGSLTPGGMYTVLARLGPEDERGAREVRFRRSFVLSSAEGVE